MREMQNQQQNLGSEATFNGIPMSQLHSQAAELEETKAKNYELRCELFKREYADLCRKYGLCLAPAQTLAVIPLQPQQQASQAAATPA